MMSTLEQFLQQLHHAFERDVLLLHEARSIWTCQVRQNHSAHGSTGEAPTRLSRGRHVATKSPLAGISAARPLSATGPTQPAP